MAANKHWQKKAAKIRGANKQLDEHFAINFGNKSESFRLLKRQFF